MAPLRTPREAWVEAGLRALANGGVDAVRVEALAKALGVTKGGFYGYFADRGALLTEMLDAWERESVDDVLDRIEHEHSNVLDKVRLAGQLTFSSDRLLPIDLAIRGWARRDKGVAERLRRVDNRRMQLLRDAISTFCPDPDEVEARSLLAFCMAIGSHFLAADHPGRSRAQVRARASALILDHPDLGHPDLGHPDTIAVTVASYPMVVAVCRDDQHRFSKSVADEITLLKGLGVEGDAHAGVTVQHRSRVAADPTQPNLRQVHLIHAELHDELREQGFAVEAGQMGENITTRGLDLLALPRGTVLRLGPEAVIEVTGLRNPCSQINDFQSGLLKAVLGKDEQGQLVRKAGIMSVVLHSGPVKAGDRIHVELPEQPHLALDRV